MLRIDALDHIVLRTDRMPAMLQFYCDVLGCVEERRLQDLGLVQLRAGSALIDLVELGGELGRQGGAGPGTEGHNVDHFCLLLANSDEAEVQRYLEQQGIAATEFAERYGATGYGRSTYVQDPQGNTVELKLASN